MAALGFGSITIIDHNELELSNLNRQIAYDANDVGKNKVFLLADKLKNLNPTIKINPVSKYIDYDNCISLLSGFCISCVY